MHLVMQRGTLITTVNGINLTSNFSAGIGIGIGSYVNPTFTSIPLFLDANYYLLKTVSTPYAYGDFGYSFSTSDFISGGIMFEGGVGWKFKISNKFNLGPQFGYRVQFINKEYDPLKSISIGIAAKF